MSRTPHSTIRGPSSLRMPSTRHRTPTVPCLENTPLLPSRLLHAQRHSGARCAAGSGQRTERSTGGRRGRRAAGGGSGARVRRAAVGCRIGRAQRRILDSPMAAGEAADGLLQKRRRTRHSTGRQTLIAAPEPASPVPSDIIPRARCRMLAAAPSKPVPSPPAVAACCSLTARSRPKLPASLPRRHSAKLLGSSHVPDALTRPRPH